MQNLLSLSDISLSINNKLILDSISFTIPKATIVTIIGPNGSGKTTLARCILNLIKPTKGVIEIRKGLKIGYMPQNLSLNPYLPIQVINFLELDINNTQTKQDLQNIVVEIGIEHILNLPLQKISGGEMQKVLLAKALLKNPNLMILDEPTQGIDINGQLEFYQLIEKLRDERKISIIIISHDLHMVMKSTDYVICLNHHICCEGTVEFVNKQKDFQNLFGTDSLNAFSVYEHKHDHVHK